LKQVEEKKEGRHGSVKIHVFQRSLKKGVCYGRAEAKTLLPQRRREVRNPPQND
jgi:hypothetical protein